MRHISSAEFTQWQAFYQLEPFGPEAQSWRAAMLASILANVNRDPKVRRKPYTVSDFMPEVPMTPKEKQEDLKERISAAMRSLGGKTRTR